MKLSNDYSVYLQCNQIDTDYLEIQRLASEVNADIEEGQIYEGEISISGSIGPMRHWIVVAPFGKLRIHSIDNPIELHSWPLSLIHQHDAEGWLKLVRTDSNHPVVRLQRVKEVMGIADSHLGLSDESLKKMLTIIKQGALYGEDYIPYAVGEVLAFMELDGHSSASYHPVRQQLEKYMEQWERINRDK